MTCSISTLEIETTEKAERTAISKYRIIIIIIKGTDHRGDQRLQPEEIASPAMASHVEGDNVGGSQLGQFGNNNIGRIGGYSARGHWSMEALEHGIGLALKWFRVKEVGMSPQASSGSQTPAKALLSDLATGSVSIRSRTQLYNPVVHLRVSEP